MEKQRLRVLDEAIMYDGFENNDQYSLILTVAEKHNAVIWADMDAKIENRSILVRESKKISKAIKKAYKERAKNM